MSTTPSTGTSVTKRQDQGSSHDEVHDIGVDFHDLDFESYVNEEGKRKLTSKVWESFVREKVKGDWTTVCKSCKKRLSAKTTSGMSHLRAHLDKCPRKIFHDVGKMLKATKTKEGDVKLSAHEFNQDISRKELANMVVLHEYPLSMVDHSRFQRFVGSIQLRFKIPFRNTLKNDILKIYEYERVKMKALLERNKGRIALTTNMWTCNNQRKGFMVITAHFMDNSWTLQSRIIRFVYVQCPHTSEMLADVMMDCLIDWIIGQKVSALIVDNCSTNNAMIPIILDRLSSDSLLLNGDMFHMRCSAHILNLKVKHGLDMINDSIERIRGIKYPTANTYLPNVCNIRCVLSQWSTSPLEEIRQMASSMAQKFDTYWTDFHGVMVVATILDPRFKIKVRECYFPKIYGDKSFDEIKKIHEFLLRMFREYEGKSKAIQTLVASSSGTNVSLSQSTMVQSNLNPFSVFDEYLSFAPPTATNMKTELKIYLEEPVIPRTDNFDILRWWYANESRYPTLHCIARDILAIHVSTVASESAFTYVLESKFGASTFDDDDDCQVRKLEDGRAAGDEDGMAAGNLKSGWVISDLIRI
ncbi:hypothetical protein EZV62_010494 [Acer yangbiense]|uniref:BED-type domain-containing protein n=1 Tax=Acer yangbiense TaxID=1000413 RepID=A0A5C7I2S9_9ROSI|nr:hypothetical protein EZV62_010494 [Acer yangbiense]